MDALLEPWLLADEEAAEERLADLIEQAEPIIRRVVAKRLAGSWDDIDDVCSEARLELLLYLRRMKAEPGGRAIGEFSAYVATLATHTCHHYFRRRRPGLARLRKQIRHLLEHDSAFCLRQDNAALSRWPEKLPRAYPHSVEGMHGSAEGIQGDRDLGVLLERILESAGGPVAFETLFDMVAALWRIAPDPMASSDRVDPENVPAPTAATAEFAIDQRRSAADLWREIRALPRPQRVALLFSLRDGPGNSVLYVFPLLGIASLGEIAAALEIGQPELENMWSGLPCDDNTIGRLLGCPRQQVINLRMAARKRLANRMRNTGALGASVALRREL